MAWSVDAQAPLSFHHATWKATVAAACLALGCGSVTDPHAGSSDATTDPSAFSDVAVADGAPAADAPDAGESDAMGTFSCGPDDASCLASEYCVIGCVASAVCIPVDAATCPPRSIDTHCATDPTCPFEWYEGGSANMGCCENAMAAYSCVDAAPPIFDGGSLKPNDCVSLGPREFLGHCQL